MEALRAFESYVAEHGGRPPTAADVAERMSPAVSRSRARQLLDALVEAGRLEREEGIARGLRVARSTHPATTAAPRSVAHGER